MKIGIVGAGAVGSSIAFLLAISGIGDEIILVDRNQPRAIAEAEDVAHAVVKASVCRVVAGKLSDLRDVDVVIFTCGERRWGPGESRVDLSQANVRIYADILREIGNFDRDPIFIIVTNPVEILMSVVVRAFGLPAKRVIGSGTILDSARFNFELAKYFNVNADDVLAEVFGEHGDSQVPIWSSSKICSLPVDVFAEKHGLKFSDNEKCGIAANVRLAADRIISGKQATHYGIAGAVLRICKAIKFGGSVLNVSSFRKNFGNIENVAIATPTLVGPSGIENILPLKVAASELELLNKSAKFISDNSKVALSLLEEKGSRG